MFALAKHGPRNLVILALVVAGVAYGVSGCGDDDGDVTAPGKQFVITEEQSGVYSITVNFEDDEGNPVPGMEEETETETICPGVDYARDEYGDCRVTVLSSSSFRARCAEAEEMPGGDCSFSFTLDLTFVFETDTFTATGPFSIVAAGADCMEEFEINGICIVTGERTGEVPVGACEEGLASDLLRMVPACDLIIRAWSER